MIILWIVLDPVDPNSINEVANTLLNWTIDLLQILMRNILRCGWLIYWHSFFSERKTKEWDFHLEPLSYFKSSDVTNEHGSL